MAIGGLGGGLDMLFEENSSDVQVKRTLRLSELEPNRAQPRKNFDEASIADLADSIRQHGVLQPLLVRPMPTGGYQIVAGERRWRAARMLGLDEIPVVIRELTDLETTQIGLIENLQRENLNPIEEALGYRRLQDEFDMKQEEIAKTVGRSRSAVANAIRILRLPEEVQELLIDGSISSGHARALLAFSDEEKMITAAHKAAAGLLTVRQLEKMAAELDKAEEEAEQSVRVHAYYGEVEHSLHERLGRKVKVQYKKNKGTLTLEFYDDDDLRELANLLSPEDA
ncbi:MAG: ParB/RepB/Spo0J family partition protein [Oscillospiraceae bacterium]|jgi:ParB family chromosome partitioning protein|nr:ParB/RepB/Spo0J family partition protein [Oscillospiraceae bacterium]